MGRTKLTDPTLGLAHLYREGRFHQPPGVEVTGAGIARVNGWYHRREASEWPLQWSPAYPWYAKDDGSFCYIYWEPRVRYWFCNGTRAYYNTNDESILQYYKAHGVPALPPAGG